MIKPTVGRVVLFTPAKSDQHCNRYSDQPMPAIVAHVWGDRMVNLAVFDHAGIHHSYPSIPLKQGDGQDRVLADGEAFCEWMPYQKAVAAGETAATLHQTPK